MLLKVLLKTKFVFNLLNDYLSHQFEKHNIFDLFPFFFSWVPCDNYYHCISVELIQTQTLTKSRHCSIYCDNSFLMRKKLQNYDG